VQRREITEEAVRTAMQLRPRRICLASTHANALKEQPGNAHVGLISFPFDETIKYVFEKMTGLSLFPSKFTGSFRSIRSQEELSLIKQWVDSIKPHVFLRDTLSLSMALSEHFVSDGSTRSMVGELEYQAKYHQNEQAIAQLVDMVVEFIQKIPGYKRAVHMCAVPPRPGKEFDLPALISYNAALRLEKTDITSRLRWNGKKPSLKETPVDQKWQKLTEVGMSCSASIAGPVVLIDDLYQSGITMQYVASMLINSGAPAVYGLSIVKSRNDADNV